MGSKETRSLLKQTNACIKSERFEEARDCFRLALSSLATLEEPEDIAIAIVFEALLDRGRQEDVRDYFAALRQHVLLHPELEITSEKTDHAVRAYLKAGQKLGMLGETCDQLKKIIDRRRKQRGSNDEAAAQIAALMEGTLEELWRQGEPLDDVNPSLIARIESRHRRRCYDELERLVEEFEKLCETEDGDALFSCLMRINKAMKADPRVLDDHKGLRQRLLNDIADVSDILSSPDKIVQLLTEWQPHFEGEKNELRSIVTLALARALSAVDRPTIVQYGDLVLQHGKQIAAVDRWPQWMHFCEQYLLSGSLEDAGEALTQAVDACYKARAIPSQPGACPWLTHDRRLRNAMLHLPTGPLCSLFALALTLNAPPDHWIYRAVQRVVDQWWHLKPRFESERLVSDLVQSAENVVDETASGADPQPTNIKLVDDLRARLVLSLLSASRFDDALALYDRFCDRYHHLRTAPQFVRRVAHKLVGRRPRGWHKEKTHRNEQELLAALANVTSATDDKATNFGDLFSGGGIAGMTAVCMATTFRILVGDHWLSVRALREQELPDSDLHLDTSLNPPLLVDVDEWWQRWYKDLGRELLAAWAGSIPGQAKCTFTIGADCAIESLAVKWQGPGAASNGVLQEQDEKGVDSKVVFKKRVNAAVKSLHGKPALHYPDQKTVRRVEVTVIFCCDARTIMRYPPVAIAAAAAGE